MLVLGLKECLVECATLCVKIEVILVTKLSRKKKLEENWSETGRQAVS